MLEITLTPIIDAGYLKAQIINKWIMRRNIGTNTEIRFLWEYGGGDHDYCDTTIPVHVKPEEIDEYVARLVGQQLGLYDTWLDKVTDGATQLHITDPKSGQKQKGLQPLVQAVMDRQIKDSGERRQFSTGSKRDKKIGKGRYDLIPQYLLDCLAQLYEQGAQKYDDNNWLLGQPFSDFYDSAQRHQGAWRNKIVDEPHLVQAIWNLTAILVLEHEIELGRHPHPEIADMGHLSQTPLTQDKE